MKNDDFLTMCKSIDPSAAVNREKNLATIKTRLKKEQFIMKKHKRPFVAVAVIAAVLTLSLAVYATVPLITGRIIVDIHVFDDIYLIQHPTRNMSFTLANSSWEEGGTPQATHLSFQDAAIVMADVIYSQFGFCINGMEGYMSFWDGNGVNTARWSGSILCYEQTMHSEGGELFHVMIDASTGEVLFANMNTPENPFRG